MSRNHAAAGNYREEMLARTGPKPVCVDFAQGGCRGLIEADHVVPLSQGGPRDWTVPRCQEHHKDKSNRDRGAVMAKAKAKAEPVKPTPTWVRIGLLVVGVPFAVGPVLYSTGQLGTVGHWLLIVAVPLVVLSVGGYAVSYTFTERRRHRAEAVQRLATVIAYALKVDLAHVNVEVSGKLSGSARYPQTVLDDDPQIRRTVEERLVSKLGADLSFDWTPELDTVSWTPGQGGRTVDKPAPDTSKAIERTAASLSELVKGPVVLTESGGRLKATYPDKVRDDVDDVRASFADVLSAKMRGRWKAAWDTAGNTATFERRPSMPAVVPHPIPSDLSDTWRLPLGVDENGDVVSWDLKVAPHGLVVGSTGSGKSVVLSGVIVEALARKFEVVVIDAKGTTLAGFRRVPGVTRTGLGEPEDMAEAMEATEALMRERYRSVREDGAEPDDFTPVLIVLDEAAEYATNVSRWWKSEGAAERGSKVRDAPALDSWRSIARLGRECHVHLVVGIQQAAAGFFGGTESRDQLPARIACGPLTQEAARMTFGRSDVGRDVPKDAKGRATVDLGSGPVEVQMWWTPTPKPNGVYRDEDAALLRELLPK